jgi:hypothetical protein
MIPFPSRMLIITPAIKHVNGFCGMPVFTAGGKYNGFNPSRNIFRQCLQNINTGMGRFKNDIRRAVKSIMMAKEMKAI